MSAVTWVTPTQPNLVDYQTFLYNVVGVNILLLPASNGVIQASLNTALEIVNTTLAVGCPPATQTTPTVYVFAVYNLGFDRIINFAQDQTGQTYFEDLRKKYHIHDVSLGVIAGGSDQGTSAAVANPEQMKLFTLQDLQTLKTPWGRTYMAYAQMYGRTIWGLS